MQPGVFFRKYHALGNDYLVVTPVNRNLSKLAVQICDRNRGFGADGILVEEVPRDGADFSLRIINPDGSEAEKSGNGLRIFARWLWDSGRLSPSKFQLPTSVYSCKIWTAGGIVTAIIPPTGNPVTIQMGRVRLPFTTETNEDPNALIDSVSLGNGSFRAMPVNLGNPHLVVDVKNIVSGEPLKAGSKLAKEYGKILEHDVRFPNRTNVQFLLSAIPEEIQIAIWERGAGYTFASGSSACAAAAAAYTWGLCKREVDVITEGGTLHVFLDENFEAHLTGPVTPIGEGHYWGSDE